MILVIKENLMKKWEHKLCFKEISLWKKSTLKKKNWESKTKGACRKVLSQILNEHSLFIYLFGQP